MRVALDRARVLADYDAQIRRNTRADGTGARAEQAGPVLRWTTEGGEGWSGIVWSDLDAATADRAIADQVGFFAARGEPFEWKLFSYDQPPDLGERLLAVGFAAEDEESVMVADTAQVAASRATQGPLPDGVRLVRITDEAGVARLIEVHERVFGADQTRLRQSLAAQLRRSPEITAMVVAMAGDEPVCSARAEFSPGTDFASLWGGGTLPSWRGRGLYRALVGYRARLAAERGYRYLEVDASPDSRPILERLGFECLARTTPYVWIPGAPAG